ncbi:MAG: epoxyqueuosine reductase QueH [Clostridiales bacterium]|nr:epoxyqueuosine reductase QueH [Clostridiales bacterium]
MDMVRNYQKELDRIIEGIADGEPPRLLLHSCCAPCSSYVLEYLREFFKITVFYYNPNISLDEEYKKRVAEQKRLIAAYNEISENMSEHMLEDIPKTVRTQVMNMDAAAECRGIPETACPIDIIEGDYEPEEFFVTVKGLEHCQEGGERCFKCFEMRLRKTSQIAIEDKYDYFTTTLTISPLKNAPKINEIGERIAKECGVRWLPSDFKKKGGYQRSIELSKEYDLYRQDYCGCIYSKAERERQRLEKQ